MSTSASKSHKRIDSFWAAKKALEKLRRVLGDALATTEDALKALEAARKDLEYGKARSEATVVGERVKRDALPRGIRSAFRREIGHLEKLMERVKAVPVTKEQRLLVERARKEKG